MYEQIISNTEELNAMAVHLRISKNFSELKRLAAQWLVPEQDVEDFISGKRYQHAEIPLSEKEYASAAEKIREEMWLLKDKFFTDIVSRYLIKRAGEDVMFGFRVLQKQKTLQKCMNYIMEQAYKIAEKEQEKKSGGGKNKNRQGNRQNEAVGVGLTEVQVYQWAEEYYMLDDAVKEAKEKEAEKKKRLKALKKKEERKKKALVSQKGTSTVPAKVSGKTIEKEDSQNAAEKKNVPKKQDMEGAQLSLFDLGAGSAEKQESEGEK